MLATLLTTWLAAAPYPAPLAAWGCATCHAASHPKHDAKALLVFDLDREGWARRLEEKRLPKFRQRLSGKNATEAEIAEVEAFIAKQRAAP